MNVLSLFDGISACHLALTRAGFEVDKYYTSEIDKYAEQVSMAHYPDAIRLGDVTKWQDWDIDWASIDLVTGGFPCQAWSVAGKQMGDKDPRGMLFWTMLDIMKTVLAHNPKAFFLMENVKMKKEFEQYITHHTEQALGKVEKHLVNSALVSAQNRQRYYWTNIQGIEQPQDKGIFLKDIIEYDFVGCDKAHRQLVFERPCEPREFNENSLCHHAADATDIKGNDSIKRVYAETGKAPTLSTCQGGHREPKVLVGRMVGRKINPETGKRDDYNQDLKAEQRIETRLDDKCGALTTVQKDNLLITNKVLINESATKDDKSYSLTASYGGAVAWNSCQKKQRTMIPFAESDDESPNTYNGLSYRKLTPTECERLQTFPDGWTECVSNTQRYKALGNAWTVDVIAHIFRSMK